MPRRTNIPTSRTRRSGRCSKRSVRTWCLMSARSTDSMPSPRRCPKPVSCGSTRTVTRSTPARLAGPSRSAPMPTVWNAGRMDGSWDAMIAPLAAARRSTTRSTTSRFWRANLAPCATGRRSRSGTCLRPCAGFSESSNDSPAATARWSISPAPCSPMAWMRSKPPVQRPCLTTFIPPASC